MSTPIERAILSLEGLSVGDSFGELFFTISIERASIGALPEGPWPWTDDTHMALSVVEVLRRHGHIEQNELAQAFARRFQQDPFRGYGVGAGEVLTGVSQGQDWRKVSRQVFGSGSYGNGAAMRVAPVGGYFAGDPAKAGEQAALQAVVTHAHPDGQAGAMAVAVTAAFTAVDKPPEGAALLRKVLDYVPRGMVRDGLMKAITIPGENFHEAVRKLGTGDKVTAEDTVPYCLWCAAYHLHNFEEAMWWTVRGLGDRDTTCAIVGGIVALSARRIPRSWTARRERLPPGFSREEEKT
ncbi:MAG: ADP-ribosylglycohydrolase family protein [Kiritimatiellae bacterium]|nr:ADP-ribosylglycohydrolase family protein [Kiritimatiellia bacterium]